MHADVRVLRAVRWAIKRLIRAAFELVMQHAGTHTRDLYWCCSEVERTLPDVLEAAHACAPCGVRAHMAKRIAAVERCCAGELLPTLFRSFCACVLSTLGELYFET